MTPTLSTVSGAQGHDNKVFVTQPPYPTQEPTMAGTAPGAGAGQYNQPPTNTYPQPPPFGFVYSGSNPSRPGYPDASSVAAPPSYNDVVSGHHTF